MKKKKKKKKICARAAGRKREFVLLLFLDGNGATQVPGHLDVGFLASW